MTDPSGVDSDQVRVTMLVAVDPETAFKVFTEEIDQWWRRGVKFRASGSRPGVLRLEPWVGGQLLECIETETGSHDVTTGRVIAWEPPSRLVFQWQGVNFAADESMEVEVTFTSSRSGTSVTLTHRGWNQIRKDHPARHNLSTNEFCQMLGMWWFDLMVSLREQAAGNGQD